MTREEAERAHACARSEDRCDLSEAPAGRAHRESLRDDLGWSQLLEPKTASMAEVDARGCEDRADATLANAVLRRDPFGV